MPSPAVKLSPNATTLPFPTASAGGVGTLTSDVGVGGGGILAFGVDAGSRLATCVRSLHPIDNIAKKMKLAARRVRILQVRRRSSGPQALIDLMHPLSNPPPHS